MFALSFLCVLVGVGLVWAIMIDLRGRRHGVPFRSTTEMWRYEREARRSNWVRRGIRPRMERNISRPHGG